MLAPLDIPTDGTFDKVKAHRRIRFFDTADNGLNSLRYVFRERIGCSRSWAARAA